MPPTGAQTVQFLAANSSSWPGLYKKIDSFQKHVLNKKTYKIKKLVSAQQPLSRRNFLEFLNPQVVSQVVLYKLNCTEQTPGRNKSQFLEHNCEVAESFMDIRHHYLILQDRIDQLK